jgi:ERCC4-type nuclease
MSKTIQNSPKENSSTVAGTTPTYNLIWTSHKTQKTTIIFKLNFNASEERKENKANGKLHKSAASCSESLTKIVWRG